MPATNGLVREHPGEAQAGATWLHEVAAEASPLHERLSGLWVAGESEALCTERWERWAAKSNPTLLRQQLTAQGLSPEVVRSLLGRVRLAPGRPLPSWTDTVSEALRESASLAGDWARLAAEDPAMRRCEQARWRAFFLPVLRVARRRLAARTGELLKLLTGPAAEKDGDAPLTEFERILILRLCASSEPTLDLEFSIWNALHPGSGALFPAEHAQNFIADSWRTAALFREHPVIARMAGVLVELWIDTVEEFLVRFDADRRDIAQTIFGGAEPGPVAALECALSDPHEGGRSVTVITFPKGRKLVYKPRNVGLEEAYYQFAAWANAAGLTPALRTVRTLDRGTHGWMEFVAEADCRSREEATRYFERCGALLAVLHALAGSDLHLENLIAAGEHPTPIDLEVLMSPDLENWTPHGGGATREISERLSRSVLSVGLLPQWMVERKGKVSNIGAFSVGEEPVPGARPGEFRHVPRLDGRVLSSGDHVPEILRGFEAAYRFLLAQRAELLREDGPLARFQNRPLRHVHRSTALYARMIVHASEMEFQRAGVLRSIEFETCTRTALLAAEFHQAGLAAIGAAEIRALEQRDVPFFTGNSSNRDLHMPGGVLRDFFRRDGCTVSRHRIEALGEDDLALQKRLIQGSFDVMNRQLAPSKPAPASAEPIFLADEARRLADWICRDAMEAGDTATWIAPVLIPRTEAYQVSLIHSGLYDGSCGLMLFLLAAEKHLGHARGGELARRILHGIEEQQAIRRSEILRLKTSSGLAGAGGRIYSLTLASRLTGDRRFAALAAEIASGMVGLIAQDKAGDIVEGSAGAIPAFLALHAATGDTQWKDAACAYGDRLLETREETPNGARSWRTRDVFLSGYSHGAAGIAASLLRLFAVTQADRFRTAALETIAYENSLYDPAKQNWQDLRDGRTGSFVAAWCHGAPGIALGRILGLAGHDDSAARADIDAAIATTLETPLGLIDHCCCGNCGRADILLTAASALDRTDLAEAARTVLMKTAAKARSLGGYVCYGQLPATVRGPGFFQGLAGIGYTMIRSENPGLASILAMEFPALS